MPYWQYYGYAITLSDDYILIEQDSLANNSEDAYFCQFIKPDVVKELLGQTLTVSYLEHSNTPTIGAAILLKKATFEVPVSIPLVNTRLISIPTTNSNVTLEVYLRSDGFIAVQFHFDLDGWVKIAAVKLEVGNESTLCYLNKDNTWQLIDIHDKRVTAERCGIRSYQDNILDNPLFNINQRRISYGSGIAASDINYPCFRDRWRVYGSSTYLYVYDRYKGVKVKHGKTSTTGIQQRIDSTQLYASMTYTFSAFIKLEEETDRGNTSNGLTNVILSFGDDRDNIIYSKVLTQQQLRVGAITLCQFTFSIPANLSNSYCNVRIRNSNQNDEIIYSIIAAKFEPGYISTLGDSYQLNHTYTFDSTDYEEQLARCRRYLQVNLNNDPLLISQDVTLSGVYADTGYIFPATNQATMATTPTITTQDATKPICILESNKTYKSVYISDIKNTWNRPCFSITGLSGKDYQRVINAEQQIFWSCEP